MTQDEFIALARKTHGDRYDYSETQFTGISKKVRIICRTHGPFESVARNHIAGSHCLKCAGKARLTTAEFIENARQVHGDRYDYSQARYINNSTKLTVICPGHGPFEVKPNNHVINRSGCPACNKPARTTLESFIARARQAHGDRYDYSQAEYRDVSTKVTIICPEHGTFEQFPYDHTQGRGCPACGIEKSAAGNRRSLAEFIQRAREFHGDHFDYSRSVYTNSTTPIEIICPDHGPFWQVPQDHITRYGCAACAGLAAIDFCEFSRRAQVVHQGKYQYIPESYTGWRSKVTALCSIHGEFPTTPKYHIDSASGCPACAREATSSQGETQLADWIAGAGFEIRRNDRETLGGFELDIYVPAKRVGIEYHGAYWHSDQTLSHPRAHEMKAAAADKAGIRLITVWDFDWSQRRDFMEAAILHQLGASSAPRLNARSCRVERVSNRQANAFYERTHIQGKCWRQLANYALLDGERIVACMSFTQGASRRGKTGSAEWELIRYASDGIVRGGASRLFSRFVDEHAPRIVWSFSDRQHFGGGLYERLGFERDTLIPADYRVYHQGTGRLWHKSAWQRRSIPARLAELGIAESFDPATDPRTERDMQVLARCLRIMDAGKIRWRWEKKTPA